MRLRILGLLLVFVFAFAVKVQAATVFTPETLSQYDGKNGHSAYFAYKGKVYDASGLPHWGEGEHYGYQAGKDLTGTMESAPHGEEVLKSLNVVGTYGTPTPSAPASPKPWYAGRIRLFGITLLGWTGILLGFLFLLNFLTCFSMPWSSVSVPWKGSRPGPDALDSSPVHLHMTSIHKYFAWSTLIIGVIHGVIGFMQMLGYTL